MGTATAIAQECGILPPAGASASEWLASHTAASAATRAGGGWFRDTEGGGSSIVVASQGSHAASLLASGDAHSSALGALAGVAAGGGARTLEDGGSASCSGGGDGLPPGVVMEGAEFRQRVLNEDGSINKGGLGGATGLLVVGWGFVGGSWRCRREVCISPACYSAAS